MKCQLKDFRVITAFKDKSCVERTVTYKDVFKDVRYIGLGCQSVVRCYASKAKLLNSFAKVRSQEVARSL